MADPTHRTDPPHEGGTSDVPPSSTAGQVLPLSQANLRLHVATIGRTASHTRASLEVNLSQGSHSTASTSTVAAASDASETVAASDASVTAPASETSLPAAAPVAGDAVVPPAETSQTVTLWPPPPPPPSPSLPPSHSHSQAPSQVPDQAPFWDTYVTPVMPPTPRLRPAVLDTCVPLLRLTPPEP
ncbi:hypothetical protein ESCO_003086 [Escovopsis weberi]|uniref:Uncharacterized protein n=1 Tax=Escovopsis weberi TaxID=150374 RepID=A0A0M8N1H7_ESCWE|nr:hypothetical protein ESCO_003086 [Escovopsis weberi]